MKMEEAQGYYRFVTVCDFLFVLVFAFVQSFIVGIWLGLELYLFIPVGVWAVTGALAGFLAVILSVGFIAAVSYGAVVLWKERDKKKQKLYNCCLIISILLVMLIIISGIVLNVLGLRNLWINLLGITGCAVLAILNAVGFWLKRRKRPCKETVYKKNMCKEKIHKKESKEEYPVKEIGVEVLKGEYEGAVFNMDENEKIVLGTQPEYCQIVFCNPYISRRHCAVCYKAELQGYEIVDYSKNGTFWMNGDRLPFGKVCVCPPGTVFMIENQNQMFRFI